MPNRELTPGQTSTLIDFLKRWGIDDPMLLAEMTDHYTEKALEEMETCKTWEFVLDSWKTKKTFRTLKTIQEQYKEHSKKEWKKRRWAIFKSLLAPNFIALIAFGLITTFYLIQIKYVSVIILGLVILKAILMVIFMIFHYTFNKLKRNLYTSTKIGMLWFPNYLLSYNFFPLLFKWDTAVAADFGHAAFISIAIFITVICDVMLYKVWEDISSNSTNITREMLIEWEGPKKPHLTTPPQSQQSAQHS